MKTIFTLLLSTLFSLAAMAGHNDPMLSISTLHPVHLKIEIDGLTYNMHDRFMSFEDLHRGYHTVRIYREIKKNNGRWNFGLGNRRQDMIYSSRIHLKDGYHFDITINRFGKAFTDERLRDRDDDWFDDDDDVWDRRDRRYEDRDRRYDNRNDNFRVMSQSDFEQAKESLKREWFENTRLNSARQIIDRNYFNTDMVRELLYLFTFENNRLELAKQAYGRTVDKGNYYRIKDVLSMSRNKEELDRYIRDYR